MAARGGPLARRAAHDLVPDDDNRGQERRARQLHHTGLCLTGYRQGLLVELDPDDADDADGQPMYEIRSPGAPLAQLGYMLAPAAGGVVSFGPGGTFALGAGPGRYAWMTKSALICQAATERCRALPATRGTLTLDPAWSPNGKALAFVEAPSSNAGSL